MFLLPHREVWQEEKKDKQWQSTARRGSDNLEERELIYEKLPQDIAERHVLLLVCGFPPFPDSKTSPILNMRILRYKRWSMPEAHAYR